MFKRILKDSFTLVFWNLETVFKACGAWFVLQFVLLIAVQMTLGGSSDLTEAPAEVSPGAVLMSMISFVFGLISSASISVAWHRFGLLGDVPGIIHLKVGAIEIQFILKSLMIALVALAAFLPISLVLGLVSALAGSPALMMILFVPTAIVLMPYFIRLYLALPATAIERPIGLKEAFVLGRGLGWQMFGAAFVLVLPFILLSLGLQLLLTVVGGGLPLILIQFKVLILNLLLQIVITVLSISVITAGYRIAMERMTSHPEQ